MKRMYYLGAGGEAWYSVGELELYLRTKAGK